MERIDDLMECLKGQMPVVPEADALTDSIMAAIEVKRIPMWVKVVRTVSSVAAAVLLILLLNLNVSDKTSDMTQAVAAQRYETSIGTCEDCTVSDIYRLALERREKRIKSETLKQKLYANYIF